MLEAKHVSYTFGKEWALQNLSFSVKKGEFVFVTGNSGAGKTTLIRLLHGAIPLNMGSINIAGFDLKNLKKRYLPKLRRNIGVVFQDFKVLENRTVYENVALPLQVVGCAQKEIKKRIYAVLRGLDLYSVAKEKCGELSGGEQQRVAIARAVIIKPRLLLADEPTGNLDDALSNRLLDVFKQFNKHGTTIILATHDNKVLESNPNSKILYLQDGKLIDAYSTDAESNKKQN